MILSLGGNTRFMEPRFNNLFMRHHQHADEIVMSRTGIPLAAVYFTPTGKHPEDLRSLIRAIRDRVKPIDGLDESARAEKEGE